MPETKVHYTVQEVADILKVKPRTVMEWLRTGKLGGFKLSDAPKGEWRIPDHALEFFIEQRTKHTKQEIQQSAENTEDKKMA